MTGVYVLEISASKAFGRVLQTFRDKEEAVCAIRPILNEELRAIQNNWRGCPRCYQRSTREGLWITNYTWEGGVRHTSSHKEMACKNEVWCKVTSRYPPRSFEEWREVYLPNTHEELIRLELYTLDDSERVKKVWSYQDDPSLIDLILV